VAPPGGELLWYAGPRQALMAELSSRRFVARARASTREKASFPSVALSAAASWMVASTSTGRRRPSHPGQRQVRTQVAPAREREEREGPALVAKATHPQGHGVMLYGA
jgi:hypothetical protein